MVQSCDTVPRSHLGRTPSVTLSLVSAWREPLAFRSDQFAIREITGLDYPAQRVYEDVIVVAVPEPPFQFFHITVEMLDRHLVERTCYRPFEQRPHAFDGIRVDVAINAQFRRRMSP